VSKPAREALDGAEELVVAIADTVVSLPSSLRAIPQTD
jgi:hypothetical protein